MSGSTWFESAAAIAMLTIAAISLGKVVAGAVGWRSPTWDSDILHVAMGVAMAGMLEARLMILPSAAWVAAFGFATVWFCWRSAHAARTALANHLLGHGVAHVAGSAAMVYMFIAVPSCPAMTNLLCGGRMAGMVQVAAGPPSWPSAALVLGALVMVGTLWLPRYRAFLAPAWLQEPSGNAGHPVASAWQTFVTSVLFRPVAASCQIVMGLTMTVMLLTQYR